MFDTELAGLESKGNIRNTLFYFDSIRIAIDKKRKAI